MFDSTNGSINTVGAEQEFDYGTVVSVKFNPSDHYHFEKWSDGVTSNPRIITLNGDKSVSCTGVINSYTITATATNGSVSGAGSYVYGSTCTLTVSPSTHYHFVRWTDGNTQNPRSFTVTGNASYSAVCSIDTFTVSLSGSNCTLSGAGTYSYGQTCTISCSPYTGYHFNNWTSSSTSISSNPYTFTVLSDKSFSANVAINTYTVSCSSTNGSVSGTGTYSHGSTCTLTFTPASHYHFSSWSDGSTSNPYSFVVTGNKSLSISGAIDYHTISATATNGSVSGAGSYAYGSTATLTFTPSSHYHFSSWSDGNTSNPRSVVVTGDATYSISGSIDYHTVSSTVTNGTVSGAGSYAYGSTCTLTAHPNTGYGFTQWSDGIVTNPRSFIVTGDVTLNGTCSILRYIFNPSISGGVGGTITAVYTGTSTAVELGSYVDYGSSITTTITFESGYTLVSWSDGVTSNPRTDTITGHFNVVATLSRSYSISATCAPTSAGTAKVAGAVHPYTDPYIAYYGEKITIRVMPKIGYTFKQWVKGGTVVSTSTSFSYTVDDDAHFVAQFEL